MPFRTLRARLLIWYFLLAVCTTGIAVWVTRQIYCNRLDDQATASLMEEVERFRRSAIPLSERQPSTQDVTELFDQFLENYVPTEHELIFAFTRGNLYRTSGSTADFARRYPQLIDEWSDTQEKQIQRIANTNTRLLYGVEPLVSGGDVQGVFVVLQDKTLAYQSGTAIITLVLKVSVAVLGVFFIVAWITAGRILIPLRLMNQTARQITESDMTQRIPTGGSGEITEVATTFNEMLDRLQVAFDSQKEFVKDVSHELRTPITVIHGQLELLSYRPDKQPETIALMMNELAQMNRLVNDLLLLTKAECPNFLILKPEDLDWLTEELYFKARSLTSDRNWRLEAKGLYPATIDRQRFSQAVMNLVQNAVRHTQPGDSIALGSAVTDGDFRFWVRDTGEGIAPADQARIFERFTRATNNNRQFEGAGLGLSIVTAIVQAHQGRIELASELGKGATFTLVIPLEPPMQSLETDERESYSHRRRQPSHH